MRGYHEYACTYCEAISCHPIGQGFRGPRDEQVCKDCYQIFEYHDVDQAVLDLCKHHRITLKKLADRVQVLIIAEEK